MVDKVVVISYLIILTFEKESSKVEAGHKFGTAGIQLEMSLRVCI